MISDKADKVINEFLIHLKIDIRIIWNQWKVASLSLVTFIYKCHKINPNCGRSYIDSPDSIQKQ